MTKEIKKQAAELFAKTVHNQFYVNPRGGFFTNENFCINSLQSGETYEVITRGEIEAEQTPQKDTVPTANDSTGQREDADKPLSHIAKEAIAQINQATSMDELTSFAGDTRKTVQSALAKKTAELSAANSEPSKENE